MGKGGEEGPGRTIGGGEQGNRGALLFWGKVAPNIKGTESSVPMYSVQVLEYHNSTMSMIWGHIDRFKINKKKNTNLMFKN